MYLMKRPLNHTSLQRPPTKQEKPAQQATNNSARRQHNTQPTSQQQDQHHQVSLLTPRKCCLTRNLHRSPTTVPRSNASSRKKQGPSPTLTTRGDTSPGSNHETSEKPRIYKLRSVQLKWTTEARTHSPDYTNAPVTIDEEQQQTITTDQQLNTSYTNLGSTPRNSCTPHARGSRHHWNPNRNNTTPSPNKTTHDRKHRTPSAENHHDIRQASIPFPNHQCSLLHSLSHPFDSLKFNSQSPQGCSTKTILPHCPSTSSKRSSDLLELNSQSPSDFSASTIALHCLLTSSRSTEEDSYTPIDRGRTAAYPGCAQQETNSAVDRSTNLEHEEERQEVRITTPTGETSAKRGCIQAATSKYQQAQQCSTPR